MLESYVKPHQEYWGLPELFSAVFYKIIMTELWWMGSSIVIVVFSDSKLWSLASNSVLKVTEVSQTVFLVDMLFVGSILVMNYGLVFKENCQHDLQIDLWFLCCFGHEDGCFSMLSHFSMSHTMCKRFYFLSRMRILATHFVDTRNMPRA